MIHLPAALQHFLRGIETADWDGIEAYLAPDVLYDATVPGWHYQYAGCDRIAEEYRSEWTGRHPWQLRELHVALTAEGAIVEFEARAHAPIADGRGTMERCARGQHLQRRQLRLGPLSQPPGLDSKQRLFRPLLRWDSPVPTPLLTGGEKAVGVDSRRACVLLEDRQTRDRNGAGLAAPAGTRAIDQDSEEVGLQ